MRSNASTPPLEWQMLVFWLAENFDTFAAEHTDNPDYWDAIKWAQVLSMPEAEDRAAREMNHRLAAQRAEQPSVRRAAPICRYRGQQRAARL